MQTSTQDPLSMIASPLIIEVSANGALNTSGSVIAAQAPRVSSGLANRFAIPLMMWSRGGSPTVLVVP
jgi:hypothetical protein